MSADSAALSSLRRFSSTFVVLSGAGTSGFSAGGGFSTNSKTDHVAVKFLLIFTLLKYLGEQFPSKSI